MKARIKKDSGVFEATIPIARAGDIIEVEPFRAFPDAPASTEIVIASETGLIFRITDLEIIETNRKKGKNENN